MAAADVRQKKRRRETGDVDHHANPRAREGSEEKATTDKQKKMHRPEARGEKETIPRDHPPDNGRMPPDGAEARKTHREEEGRDVAKQGERGRGKNKEAPKAPQPGDLPALKKKRHLLYGQLQEARQEVS